MSTTHHHNDVRSEEGEALYVTDTNQLRELVATLRRSPLVGIDTEFMRERTYYAKLCLIQVATDEVAAIVDPLAFDDLSPLCELLADQNVLKILHAGSQDLEIFYQACGIVTAPVFDTQIAATLTGFPQQVGLGALMNEVLGKQLDKGDTYTDWARRPLSETQVEYALNDVRYLLALYRNLAERLERDGRMAWLQSDFRRLEDPATYEVVPEEQWRRVKRVSSLNRRQLAVAREVAAWRERTAMRRDIPKRWVLGDESIVEIARRVPSSADELMAIRGVTDKIGRGAVAEVLVAVQRGLAVPDDELPSIAKRRKPVSCSDEVVDLMVALTRKRARENGVAMPLLASRDDLERLAGGVREGHPLLTGWRADMIGNELLALLDGRIGLMLVDGELVVSPR